MYFSKRLFSGVKSYLTVIVKILILEKGMNFRIQLYRLHYTFLALSREKTHRETHHINLFPAKSRNGLTLDKHFSEDDIVHTVQD